MKIHQLLTAGFLSVFLLAGTAFAQNIQTDTTSTTVGSTQFGILMTPSDLGTVMQSAVDPSCSGPTDARVCTSLGADGTAGTFDDFVRIDALPGAHTSSPIAGEVSSQANFACGPTASSNNCVGLLNNTDGTGGPQTAPNFSGRQLVGLIDVDISVGDGGATPGMPDGFMRFTLDPASGNATIDQFIDHTVSLGSENMLFQNRTATVGLGNPIPDPIGDPLTLVTFVAAADNAGVPANVDMVSRTNIQQGNADGFGGMTLDMTVNFPVGSSAATEFPAVGQFLTPGLNTGIDFTGNSVVDNFGFP